jgi:Rps23 Pro-64 3,4-dihydroxylase Tpa1-like proline 4-hydroxylase
MMSVLTPYDRDELREQFRSASPFPWLKIDKFLTHEFAQHVTDAYPSFDAAVGMGHQFKAVNENLKVQVSDYSRFPEPVQRLSDALSSPAFLSDIAYITDIPHLLWDPTLAGGGMHETARSGWLDVHIDFNFHEQLNAHRRLNILVFLNPVWEEPWGGVLELWDNKVTTREHAFAPVHNRCVLFETNEKSWHGVTAVRCPDGIARKSFAAYYYTKGAPAGWSGQKHTTVFKPRPNEYMKRHVLMPMSSAKRGIRNRLSRAKHAVRDLFSKPK